MCDLTHPRRRKARSHLGTCSVHAVEVDVGLLCDAAKVREDVLQILGGGITDFRFASYPGALVASLALRIEMHLTEAKTDHAVRVEILGEDGQQLAQFGGEFKPDQAKVAQQAVGDGLFTCVALPLTGLQIPRAGRYSIEILIGEVHKKTIQFRAH